MFKLMILARSEQVCASCEHLGSEVDISTLPGLDQAHSSYQSVVIVDITFFCLLKQLVLHQKVILGCHYYYIWVPTTFFMDAVQILPFLCWVIIVASY